MKIFAASQMVRPSVVSCVLSTVPRNNFGSPVGHRFKVNNNLHVVALGCMTVSGNVNLALSPAASFNYIPIPPLALTTGTIYSFECSEISLGTADKWYDQGCSYTTSPDVTILGFGSNCSVSSSTGNSYVGLSFLYTKP